MTAQPPGIEGVHHFSATVTDVEASVAWYQRVFGLQRVPAPFPHHGSEESGYAILLVDPHSGLAIGLHHHDGNRGEAFDETRTGLDHLGFGVADRSALDRWAGWLDSLGVTHSGVIDTDEPVPYSVLVFRDPDNIQLELFANRTPG